jgi:hypothetical protein
MRTCLPFAADLEPIRTPASIRTIDRDPAVMPALDAAASVAFEQEAVHLQHPR